VSDTKVVPLRPLQNSKIPAERAYAAAVELERQLELLAGAMDIRTVTELREVMEHTKQLIQAIKDRIIVNAYANGNLVFRAPGGPAAT
jgi:hypothetical protein